MYDKTKQIKAEVRKNVLTYVTAAFGLVAGLAWNDAITSLIEYLFPLDKGTISAKFVYAVLITIVLVAVTIYLTRFFKQKDEG